jgi:cation diffusion facilitator family transporter
MEKHVERKDRFDLADRVIFWGVAINVVLLVAKFGAGIWGRSAALRADGFESGCDLLISAAMLWAMRMSRKPYDPDHPYGHGKIESLAALLVGIGILATGLWLVVDSAHVILFHKVEIVHWMAPAVALLTVVTKEAAARYTRIRAKLLGSPTLDALAADHRKDALSSVATAVGAGAAACGWFYFDPAMAVLTALFIIRMGADTFKRAFDDLIDAALPGVALEAIKRDAATVEGVEHVHEIRGRRSGQFLIIDLKVEIDPQLTVLASHAIAEQVKQVVFRNHPEVGDVMIHVNPHDDGAHRDLIRL